MTSIALQTVAKEFVTPKDIRLCFVLGVVEQSDPVVGEARLVSGNIFMPEVPVSQAFQSREKFKKGRTMLLNSGRKPLVLVQILLEAFFFLLY